MKVLTCFGIIWNYDKFSRWNTKFGKNCALSKIHISPNLIVKKKMTYWGNYKYNIYKVSKHFIWKFIFRKTIFWKNIFFGEKDFKKDNRPKYKVNTLACYMSFGPFSITLCNMTQFSNCVLRHLMCFNHQIYVFLFTHINISAFQCDEIIDDITCKLYKSKLSIKVHY